MIEKSRIRFFTYKTLHFTVHGVLCNRRTIILIILLMICLVYYYCLLVKKETSTDTIVLTSLIESVIGMPYAQKPGFRNDSPDIRRLSKEEWFALPYYDQQDEIIKVEDKLNLAETLPSINEAKHALSLRLGHVPTIGHNLKNDIFNKLCPNFLLCSAMAFVIQDYVLEKPELLRDIVKIVERPCNYIKDIDEEIKEGEEVIYNTRYINPYINFKEIFYVGKYEDISGWIKQARSKLRCDARGIWQYLPTKYNKSLLSKKDIVIKINKTGSLFITKDSKETIDIVVHRKDI